MGPKIFQVASKVS